MRMVASVVGGEKKRLLISQWFWLRSRPIDSRIRTSPIRFIRAVIIPAARDLGFWK